MGTYRVELVNRDRFALTVAEGQYILEAIEATGMRLPVGCRYGACITCAARLVEGKVEQLRSMGKARSETIALKPAQVAKGYVLLCIASPLSDCRFEVGRESQDELYVNPFRAS